MQLSIDDIAGLMYKQGAGTITPAEAATLEAWTNADPRHQQWFENIQQEGTLEKALMERSPIALANLEKELLADTMARTGLNTPVASLTPVRPISFVRRWWAAASILLLLAAGASFWLRQNKPHALTKTTSNVTTDIAPGKDGAILTLADGSQVVLDSLGNGVVALQNGAQVLLQNGGLVYDANGETAGAMAYNTMTTPRGRQFSLLLPDGTQVWLNAASSIRYPTLFAGKERTVELTGEAYFEVAKNAKMPFRVTLNNKAEVVVLGTHFNVSAYANEGTVHTTLLEGSVRVMASRAASAKPATVTLKPGQQAQMAQAVAGEQDEPTGEHATAAIKVVNDTDIDKVMAWKNGAFNFNDVSLWEVMQQFERWYDIEVIYESTVPDVKLRGEMTRGVTLNVLLKNLEKMGLHCRLEGRRLVVLP